MSSSSVKVGPFDYEDCLDNGSFGIIEGKVVVLSHMELDPKYRSRRNQLWVATHGPGCYGFTFTSTVHLTHLFDGDKTCVRRNDIVGIIEPEILEGFIERNGLEISVEAKRWMKGKT